MPIARQSLLRGIRRLATAVDLGAYAPLWQLGLELLPREWRSAAMQSGSVAGSALGAIAAIARPLARDMPNHDAAFRVEVTAASFDEQLDMPIDALGSSASASIAGAGGCRAVTWSRLRAATS